MGTQQTAETQHKKPNRMRKTKSRIIKETYLPYLFLALAAVLIIIFIIGALIRNNHVGATQVFSASWEQLL